MVLKGNFRSKVLDMNTGVTVILPDQYEVGKDYQVAYVLHGLGGNNSTWEENTMLPFFARNYHTIFILPEVSRSFYSDMEYGQHFYTYVTEELPEICKSIFHISSKREDTAVIGASMGGYGALRCALGHPEQYSTCVAISSACLHLKEMMSIFDQPEVLGNVLEQFGEQIIRDTQSIFGQELKWKKEYEIGWLLDQAVQKNLVPRIYMACGKQDYLYQDNTRFAAELAKQNLPSFKYEEWDGVHGWIFFNEALEKGLKFCYE